MKCRVSDNYILGARSPWFAQNVCGYGTRFSGNQRWSEIIMVVATVRQHKVHSAAGYIAHHENGAIITGAHASGGEKPLEDTNIGFSPRVPPASVAMSKGEINCAMAAYVDSLAIEIRTTTFLAKNN